MELTLQRGAQPIELDRPRILFFSLPRIWQLVQKYGLNYIGALYGLEKENGLVLKSADALAFYLWVGLLDDAEAHGEELTLEEATAFIRPYTLTNIFLKLVQALTDATHTPAGKATAAGPAAKPAAVAKAGKTHPPNPGPTRVSTSMKRNGSPSGSSAGRRVNSGR